VEIKVYDDTVLRKVFVSCVDLENIPRGTTDGLLVLNSKKRRETIILLELIEVRLLVAPRVEQRLAIKRALR